ncbi:MAG: germination protein YpeB [Clostridia bacterium]|nr:germination protein YpeB [Clostridia bacterium]
MKKQRIKRSHIRLFSFVSIAVLLLSICAVSEKLQKDRWKQTVDLTRQRAVAQLCEYFDSMHTDLEKSEYANTASMFAKIGAQIERNATGAKNALATLDAGQTQLNNIYMYLSQAGAYTSSLAQKKAAGETISEKDRKQLQQLSAYAAVLHEKFLFMNDLMESGNFSFDDVAQELGDTQMENAVSYLSAAAGAEESFEDYPTLLYDGPFSDGVLKKESAFLKSQKKISKNKAREIAADILGAQSVKQLIDDGENTGKIETYNFYYNGCEAQITKRGGFVNMLLNESFAGEIVYTGENAVRVAQQFLEKCGYKDMVSSYYSTNDGICTVNFAWKQGDYICYPDLIKVCVSLADGRVLSLDASSYLMNHSERDLPAFSVRIADAVMELRSDLRIRRVRKAVIPTDGGGENFAYEFLCADPNGQDALIYIDTQSGEEDNIFLLLYSDGGTLTK